MPAYLLAIPTNEVGLNVTQTTKILVLYLISTTL